MAHQRDARVSQRVQAGTDRQPGARVEGSVPVGVDAELGDQVERAVAAGQLDDLALALDGLEDRVGASRS